MNKPSDLVQSTLDILVLNDDRARTDVRLGISGVGIGLFAAALASRALQGFLYGVTTTVGLAFASRGWRNDSPSVGRVRASGPAALNMDLPRAMRTE